MISWSKDKKQRATQAPLLEWFSWFPLLFSNNCPTS